MSTAVKPQQPKYKLDTKGRFTIENYNQSKPFSNFFPGIAGLWGIPMWAFYVNRGQCIASFGMESKDKAIMEFQPANKSYRLTPSHGFRTFIKVTRGRKVQYWEPFQENLPGTDYTKKVKMSMTAHDLTLEETNQDLGLTVTVNYFTVPEEPFAALVRTVTVKNTSSKSAKIELIDGLPVIMPYGLSDWLIKNLSRTVEAWVKVRNLDRKAPYYHLNVEVSDEPRVEHITKGHFYFAFDPQNEGELLPVVVEAANVFGAANDFAAPSKFMDGTFDVKAEQHTSNRTPSALCHTTFELKPKAKKDIISMAGYAKTIDQLNTLTGQVTNGSYVKQKAKRNDELIRQIKNFAFTVSSSREFNNYSGHTFLDNILRGGLPVSLKSKTGNVAFNVYSRKHGDLERDYNHFTVAPTFYSQGNGNYRDVNQNRRNDAWFNMDVRENHLVNFLNLSQLDGYNPLVVKGTSFKAPDIKTLEDVLNDCIEGDIDPKLEEFLLKGFLPGHLIAYVDDSKVKLTCPIYDFVGRILEVCEKQELADHGEGFWSDHWTYNLDLIESYLAVYPEELKRLLLEQKEFHYYFNNHYVLPRDQRYILTPNGVRQYASVEEDEELAGLCGTQVRTDHGAGDVYHTHLACKLLTLIANKAASLDPSGIGVEMEADKPNWYDALNGLPGLIGSSISETIELKRYAMFLLSALDSMVSDESASIEIYEELAQFIKGLAKVLADEKDAYSYWLKSNDVKEHYRATIRKGVSGSETAVNVNEIKAFLKGVVDKTNKAFESAYNDEGFLATYFYHEVTDYKILDKYEDENTPYVQPIKFLCHKLPLFLEGYVHALRASETTEQARELYSQIRQSDLFDRKLKMYKVNADLATETEEIGRTRVFPSGWLENASIWLHMEYKFMLELLRQGLYDEFYDNFKHVLVPFLKPKTYGRSILENSSFIVSSAHTDDSLHGQGFVARLSGSTAEFLHMWLYMNAGKQPFSLNSKGELSLTFDPALTADLFTDSETIADCDLFDGRTEKVEVPKNGYAFNFLGSTVVVYHNPKRKNTFGPKKAKVKKIQLSFIDPKIKKVTINGDVIPDAHAREVRDRKVSRIDVFLN